MYFGFCLCIEYVCMHLWMYLCMCACGCGRYVGLSAGLCVVWTRVFAFLGVGLCVSVRECGSRLVCV